MRRTAGFTLIEVMIVLGIVAILAVMAVSQIGGTPKTRLVSGVSEVRLTLLKARTMAVRTTRNTKVCIFRDGDPMALPSALAGRMVTFSCNTPGRAGCFGTTICTPDAADNGGTQWTGTVDAGPCPGATPQRWCIESQLGLDFSDSSHLDTKVSISRFLTVSNTDTGKNVIEVTYNSSGSVDTERSSYPSARIELVNRDLCSGACGALGDFTFIPYVEYGVGGSTRISN